MIVGVSAGGAAQAGLTAALAEPVSILPANVGIGIGTDDAVALDFPTSMDRGSVEAALVILPRHKAQLRWTDDGRHLRVLPTGLWSTDARYVLSIAPSARTAAGSRLANPAQFSFTTQTAPRITDFQLHFVAEPTTGAAARMAGVVDAVDVPVDTASDVSATTTIVVTFSAPMNKPEVERDFQISPAVPGLYKWSGSRLTFTPIERLATDARYAVSLVGVHDAAGNPLGGDASFSLTTRPGAQLLQSTPKAGATAVTDKAIVLWFSQSLDPTTVAKALQVRDRTNGAALSGTTTWNSTRTQLGFTPSRAFAAGHRIDVSLVPGALDADGNAVTASLTFTTKPAAAARGGGSGPPASSSLTGYALNQINSSRAAHGLPALVLDSRISAVSLAHAWDQLRYGYFSHTGRDGSTPQDRLRRAGISFGWSGENQCYSYNGARTTLQTLQWCHSAFMSEPWPGIANHIGNILSAHYTRVGIGIAVSGAKVIIVWDFTD